RWEGSARGTLGDGAFSRDSKTWRPMATPSAALDPLRARAQAAARLTREGEDATRNVFYAALEAARESEAVMGRPAKLLAEALQSVEGLAAALAGARPEGWEKDALAAGKPLVEKALDRLKSAQAGCAAGRLDSALIKSVFDAAW